MTSRPDSRLEHGKNSRNKETSPVAALLITGGIVILAAMLLSSWFWGEKKPDENYYTEHGYGTPSASFHDKDFQKNTIYSDLGDRMQFSSPYFPQGLSVDFAEWNVPESYFDHSPSEKPDGFFPEMWLSWPGQQDRFSGKAAENACAPGPVNTLERVSMPQDCLLALYKISNHMNDGAVLELLSKGRGTLGIRDRGRENELGEASRVSNNLYQIGQFVTEEKNGLPQWLGWMCNQNVLRKLNLKYGVPDYQEPIVTLDAGNANCIAPPSGFLQGIFKGWSRLQYHEVVFSCPDRNKSLSRYYANKRCRATFWFGKEILTVYFPDQDNSGFRNKDGIWYYRPHIVESAWNRLLQMQREGASESLAREGLQQRLQWSLRRCEYLLEQAEATPRGAYISPNKEIFCQRAIKRLSAAKRGAKNDLAAQERFSKKMMEIDARLARLP